MVYVALQVLLCPTNEAFNGREYQFGTPEHKARVQAETEASFKSNQKIGLRNR